MSWGSIPTSSFNKDGITTGYLQSDGQALAFFWPSDKDFWPAKKDDVKAAVEAKGHKFHPEFVKEWFVRPLDVHGFAVGDKNWDTHPQLQSVDFKVTGYVPALAEATLADRKAAEAAEAAAKRKAEFEAKKAAAEAKEAEQ